LSASVVIAQAPFGAARKPAPTTKDAPAALARDSSWRRVNPFGLFVSYIIVPPFDVI
jgi:hypothetical protein